MFVGGADVAVKVDVAVAGAVVFVAVWLNVDDGVGVAVEVIVATNGTYRFCPA